MEHVQSQKGVALIEFAFILPVFLLLLFGIVTFSVALYNKTVLTTATREGARAGIVFVANQEDDEKEAIATATAQAYISDNLISFGPDISPVVTSSINGDILTVTATGAYTGILVMSDINISAQTSMRLE
jgi:Flp pilus assembly protein TadG